MDPVSVVALVNTCLSITIRIGTISKQLWALKEKYKHAERKVMLFESQLAALSTAATGLSEWLGRPTTHDEPVRQELQRSLESCDLVVQVIMEYLAKLQAQSNKLNLWNKSKFLRDEGTISEYEGMLRGQVQALSLLLQILTLPSQVEQRDQIASAETTSILHEARDASSSMLWLRDAESARTVTSIGTENMETLDMSFDFDKLIVTSKVYRSTLASLLKQKIKGDKISKQASKESVVISDQAYQNQQSQFGFGTDTTAWSSSTTLVADASQPQSARTRDTLKSYFGRWPFDPRATTDTKGKGKANEVFEAPDLEAIPQEDQEIIQIEDPDSVDPTFEDTTSPTSADTKPPSVKSPLIDTNDDDIEEDDLMSRISSSPSIPDEDVDFEFVYALHTFKTTVEGQVGATKGDTILLLDDSNSYWWLVKVVKNSEIGYLPAEHIETPRERLARLNKHRNMDLASTMIGDKTWKEHLPLLGKTDSRTNGKVTFGPVTIIGTSPSSHPGFGDYSDEEADDVENSTSK